MQEVRPDARVRVHAICVLAAPSFPHRPGSRGRPARRRFNASRMPGGWSLGNGWCGGPNMGGLGPVPDRR
eukprot:4278180-Pleurochrysis_carterae.AAC.1